VENMSRMTSWRGTAHEARFGVQSDRGPRAATDHREGGAPKPLPCEPTMPSKTYLVRNVLYVCLGLFVLGCSGGKQPGPRDASGGCAQGDLGCACYPNLTCNSTFECGPSQTCVESSGTDAAQVIDDSAANPTGGVGGGIGSTAVGGAPGSDGSPDQGLTPILGGTPAIDAIPGSGGVGPDAGGGSGPVIDASAGGVPGSGGLPGLGGVTGFGGGGGLRTGGMPGTGGSAPIDAGAGGSQADASPCSEPALNCPCATLGALAGC
jgi:hypothetical protein